MGGDGIASSIYCILLVWCEKAYKGGETGRGLNDEAEGAYQAWGDIALDQLIICNIIWGAGNLLESKLLCR